MIAYLKGTLAASAPDHAVVEVGGVGYRLFMASRSLSRLGQAGDAVTVLTHMVVREDALVLYGFISQEEKDLFLRLTSVSSVGPKVALSVLSTYDPQDAAAAIAAQDLAAIQRVPGVGKKMASRIALELKDSLDAAGQAAMAFSARAGGACQAAAEALLSMGFTETEAQLALKGAPEDADETVLLHYALKRLGE